jgi:hypothetical protein
VQLSVYDALALNAPVLWEPEVAFDPLQLPEAVHDVALVELHDSVLLPPLLTDVGEAVNETVGAGVEVVTVTDAVRCVVPPAPVQLSVYEAFALNAPVPCEPDVDFEPLQLPDAVHDVAFVELQVSVLLPPLLTDVGDAEKESVGAGGVSESALPTATVTFAWREPPAPVHVST